MKILAALPLFMALGAVPPALGDSPIPPSECLIEVHDAYKGVYTVDGYCDYIQYDAIGLYVLMYTDLDVIFKNGFDGQVNN